ncbi:MAG: hypothetical protein ABIR73_02120 [Usitatibacter sp.]
MKPRGVSGAARGALATRPRGGLPGSLEAGSGVAGLDSEATGSDALGSFGPGATEGGVLSPLSKDAKRGIGETGMNLFEASHDSRTTAKPRTIVPPASARICGLF